MSKAPDKIYVYVDKLIGSCGYASSIRQSEEDTVYLRKDTLLEWIHTELDAIEGKEMSQMELAFTEVIDKIQRM